MRLNIQNMVSTRCIMIVKNELDNLNINYTNVELGEVEIIDSNLTQEKYDKLNFSLQKSGLGLIEDKKSMLIEKIKNVIIEMIHYSDEPPKIKFSNYLSEKLKHNYTYLSNLFSKVKGASIEHYIIAHKIERVKELLIYENLTLSEIAWKLNYSSVAHLSNQFKKQTGETPSRFKKNTHKNLIALDNV